GRRSGLAEDGLLGRRASQIAELSGEIRLVARIDSRAPSLAAVPGRDRGGGLQILLRTCALRGRRETSGSFHVAVQTTRRRHNRVSVPALGRWGRIRTG